MTMRKLAKSVQELAKCRLVVIQGTMPTLSIIAARVRGFRPSLTHFSLEGPATPSGGSPLRGWVCDGCA